MTTGRIPLLSFLFFCISPSKPASSTSKSSIWNQKHTSAMSTQYDIIRNASIALIEHEHARTTISPQNKITRVLELAYVSCFYTHSFITERGASSLLGVNLSLVMIEAARGRSAPTSSSPTNTTTTTTTSARSIELILADRSNYQAITPAAPLVSSATSSCSTSHPTAPTCPATLRSSSKTADIFSASQHHRL